MKINLAILEKDQNYLNRIVSILSTKYADKFQVYSFTSPEMALTTVNDRKIDVFVASEVFEIDTTAIPNRCGFAYLVDAANVDSLNGQVAICKFQKLELIYKQILSVYSEKAGSVSGLKFGDDNTKTIIFSSVCGGVGTSTVAVACAKHFAQQGHRTLYLNLERFGSADSFFSAEGQFDMSDIIFALKSKKTNLSMKLESCVKQSQDGVCFFSQSKVALDMLELTSDDILHLLSELNLTGNYSFIIVDCDFGLDKGAMQIYRQAHGLVWVCDGSDTAVCKTARAFTALSIMEQNVDSPLTNRLSLFYNRFSSKNGISVGDIGIRELGGAPKYENATTAQIVNQIAETAAFDSII